MKKIVNISTGEFDTKYYQTAEELRSFYRKFGLDGLEVLEIEGEYSEVIRKEDTIGVHLKHFTGWVDFWKMDHKRLLDEYVDEDTIKGVFGGSTKEEFLEGFRRNIRFANTLEPEYLVFHVSEGLLENPILQNFYYTDEEVIDATIELVNSITDEINGKPVLLFENMWLSGLTLTKPELVTRLMKGIAYKNKGIMLDTGHLLHTNRSLRTLDEAVDYILQVLERFEDFSFIKGIHLHQTLQGAYAEECKKEWIPLTGTYQERLAKVLPMVYTIDAHQPFETDRVKEIIEKVKPEYLVLELLAMDQEELSGMLEKQIMYL